MHFLRYLLLLFPAALFSLYGSAHPMPHSVLLLDVTAGGIAAELQWPLKELQLVFPHEPIDSNSRTLLQRKGPMLDQYLRQHLRVTDAEGRAWAWEIRGRRVSDTAQEATGLYHELVYQLWLQPPAGSSPRQFTMHYDAIMHQLVTHKMYVAIRQDWDGGLTEADSADAQLGVLMVNTADGKVPPLVVTLDKGSPWKGLRSMVALGMDHIAAGTDHLLFLLALLLPAPLLASGRRWRKSGGTRYAIIRLAKITTAFTIGHSLTLIAGAAGWVHLPAQPIEILIALSILFGAVHALRPLFPGQEALVAAGFGLVHGLAFAGTLASLRLDGGRMALSILGFNIGIELMQLFVILLVMPWLVILSQYRSYQWVRITGGVCISMAALGWMAERMSGRPNPVTENLEAVAAHAHYGVLCLAALAVVCYFRSRKAPAAAAPIAAGTERSL